MKKLLNWKRLKFYAWTGVGWVILWMCHIVIDFPETFLIRSLNEVWRAIYLVIVNYILFEYTLPFIRHNWKTVIKPVLLLVIQIFLYSFGLYGWRTLGIPLHIYTVLRPFPTLSAAVAYQFSSAITAILFFAIIRHVYEYIKLKQATQQLLIEKKEAELNYLKSQTNPHFLFNTLNNIYSLARDKSDLAPEAILRLSQLLRYMLYETNGAYIAIEQEIKIISDYIALEKLRYDESLQINFNHDLEDVRQALPPLLLMPLVENAFKHGISETRGRAFIDIHLSVNRRQLLFVVKNSTDTSASEGPVKENIGLSNLRRQLELLYTDYDLSFQQDERQFTVRLKINLASHV
jgi:sensor histidine kinase YesM